MNVYYGPMKHLLSVDDCNRIGLSENMGTRLHLKKNIINREWKGNFLLEILHPHWRLFEVSRPKFRLTDKSYELYERNFGGHFDHGDCSTLQSLQPTNLSQQKALRISKGVKGCACWLVDSLIWDDLDDLLFLRSEWRVIQPKSCDWRIYLSVQTS